MNLIFVYLFCFNYNNAGFIYYRVSINLFAKQFIKHIWKVLLNLFLNSADNMFNNVVGEMVINVQILFLRLFHISSDENYD